MSIVIKKPAKEQVRVYMVQRAAEHTAPPSAEEIRRRLGWQLVEAQRQSKKR